MRADGSTPVAGMSEGNEEERESLEGKWPLDDLEYIDELTPMPLIKQLPCLANYQTLEKCSLCNEYTTEESWGLTLVGSALITASTSRRYPKSPAESVTSLRSQYTCTSEEPSFSQRLPTARQTHSLRRPARRDINVLNAPHLYNF